VKLYIGNLSYNVNDDELREAFEAFGEVISAKVIKDKFTGRSRGFGFVEMGTKEQGLEAIENLNNKDIKGKIIRVSESQPREPREGGMGGSGPRGPRTGTGGSRFGSSNGGGFQGPRNRYKFTYFC
jgi:cold-inducible RNA-binding protein